MEISVKASCNWSSGAGCSLSKSVQTRIMNEDVFIKPSLEEIFREEGAILLHKSTSGPGSGPCELVLRIFPRFKIAAVTMVVTVPKVEMFFGVGKLAEYAQTIYGTKICDEDNREATEEDLEVVAYRYDIEIEKSGVVEIILKFLTPSPEICLFGILLQVAPNPNGITTLLPNAINLDNVQKILSSSEQKLSPGAEKCKLFMQMYSKNANQRNPLGLKTHMEPSALVEQMRKDFPHQLSAGSSAHSNTDSQIQTPSAIQVHLDSRLLELEKTLNTRIDLMERNLSAKLDAILQILQKETIK